jgi:hypothetical protein
MNTHQTDGGIVKYAVQMDSDAMIHTTNFVKIGLGIQKLIGKVRMEIA